MMLNKKRFAVSLCLLVLFLSAFSTVVIGGGQVNSGSGSQAYDSVPRIETSSTEIGLRLLASIALVIGLIYISIWGLKKLATHKAGGHSSATNITVIDNSYLGPKKGLHIVKAGRKYILVASSENAIFFLCELDHEDFKNFDGAVVPQNTSGRFKGMLEKLKLPSERPFLRKARNVETAL